MRASLGEIQSESHSSKPLPAFFEQMPALKNPDENPGLPSFKIPG
jgi:hypothetical protein